MKLSQQKILDPESGLILVNKPSGWTSHDVVNFVRRRFRFKKVGHCGTLDPSATGLLILVVGHATKVSEFLSGEHKTYKTVMLLGSETDSHDADGKITAEASWSHVDESHVEKVLQDDEGEQTQIPPMVSALKRDGKKLYELARKGITVEREPRKIDIRSIKINSVKLPEVDFTVCCSKGTYVRTLCHDIGKSLKTAAHMKSLVRLESSGFELKNAFEIDTLKTWERENFLENMITLRDFIRERSLKEN